MTISQRGRICPPIENGPLRQTFSMGVAILGLSLSGCLAPRVEVIAPGIAGKIVDGERVVQGARIYPFVHGGYHLNPSPDVCQKLEPVVTDKSGMFAISPKFAGYLWDDKSRELGVGPEREWGFDIERDGIPFPGIRIHDRRENLLSIVLEDEKQLQIFCDFSLPVEINKSFNDCTPYYGVGPYCRVLNGFSAHARKGRDFSGYDFLYAEPVSVRGRAIMYRIGLPAIQLAWTEKQRAEDSRWYRSWVTYLCQLICGKEISVSPIGDRQVIYVAGQDIGLEMIKAGMARYRPSLTDPQFPAEEKAYKAAEEEAKTKRIGLWQ